MSVRKYLPRRGKLFLAVVALFAVCLCFFLAVFWWNGREYAEVTFEEEYFLLVRDCETTTASAIKGQVYHSGGAGYLIGEDTVVVACYFSRNDAEFVQGVMHGKGVETRILEYAPKVLYLEGDRASEAERIAANAKTADTCARILFDTANGLERSTLSQEEARRAVRGVVSSLKGLREGNEGGAYGRWNNALQQAERRGAEITSGLLFAKDLRYLQVELCVAVSKIAELFG